MGLNCYPDIVPTSHSSLYKQTLFGEYWLFAPIRLDPNSRSGHLDPVSSWLVSQECVLVLPIAVPQAQPSGPLAETPLTHIPPRTLLQVQECQMQPFPNPLC